MLTQLFNHNFLFEIPSHDSFYFIPMAVFFGLLIIAATAILIFVRDEFKRKLLGRYVPPFFAAGTLGFIHLFARYESLIGLSTRFFFILIIGMLVIWMIVLIAWFIRMMPKMSRSHAAQHKFEKYLPKRKKELRIKNSADDSDRGMSKVKL